MSKTDDLKEKLNDRKKIILDIIHDKNYVPMKAKELAMVLNVPKEEREQLKEVLDQLVAENKISVSSKSKYGKPGFNVNTFVGTFECNPKGFGFVQTEKGDIFISKSNMNGAMHGDTVQIVVRSAVKEGKGKEGEILKVITRNTDEIIGTFYIKDKLAYVKPDNTKFFKHIYIPAERTKSAVAGHKVVVKIVEYASKKQKAEGKVKEILGHMNDPGVDIISIIKAFNIPTEYPEKVMKQTEAVPQEVMAEELVGRMDIRTWQTVTIDGEDAKDLDDAITLRKEGDHYILGVHIADVTHYVKENSPLDKEALKRGTSVYLVDRVIPMLPHKLSNGICSLNAGTDRLALSCIMQIDKKGTVVSHNIAETVINVDRRMTYTSVNKIIEDNDEAEKEAYQPFVPMFHLMAELAEILRKKRRKRGSIDFDFPESKILLDPNGEPTDIMPYERNTATKIIEDFMLIANETIAEEYYWKELPFVYRSHETPDPEKIMKLGIFINNFGYNFKSEQEIHPKELQKLLGKIEGTTEEILISRLTLRSMKQAKYTTSPIGHFGLAAKYYCHFTSPIRRYPDLQIHRIIKENIGGNMSDKRARQYEKILDEVAIQTSRTERRADEAERDTEKLKKVQYMEKYIGERFEGVISSITNWGMYVELPNTIEGMVHVTALPGDYYYYDEVKYEMVGEATKKAYKLGQKVTVEVVNTDRMLRTIDFELVEEG